MPAQEPGQMAPAAGVGIGKEVAENLTARDNFVLLMADTAAGALNASTRRWDPTEKAWIVEPDWRTRTAMFFGLLAHMEGEPVKRILIEKRDESRTADPLAMLKDSPALRAAAQHVIDQANHGAKRPRKGQPAELVVED